MEGILAIYGTTNRLTSVYWAAGIALTVTGIGNGILTRNREKKPAE